MTVLSFNILTGSKNKWMWKFIRSYVYNGIIGKGGKEEFP